MTRKQREKVRRVILAIISTLAVGAFFVMLGIIGAIEKEHISITQGFIRLAASGTVFFGLIMAGDAFSTPKRNRR